MPCGLFWLGKPHAPHAILILAWADRQATALGPPMPDWLWPLDCGRKFHARRRLRARPASFQQSRNPKGANSAGPQPARSLGDEKAPARTCLSLSGAHLPRINSRTSSSKGVAGSPRFLFNCSLRGGQPSPRACPRGASRISPFCHRCLFGRTREAFSSESKAGKYMTR